MTNLTHGKRVWVEFGWEWSISEFCPTENRKSNKVVISSELVWTRELLTQHELQTWKRNQIAQHTSLPLAVFKEKSIMLIICPIMSQWTAGEKNSGYKPIMWRYFKNDCQTAKRYWLINICLTVWELSTLKW